MSKGRPSFVKQAAILAAAGLIVRFMGFLYRLPLTALIGDVGNGIYAAGYNLYMFFLIMSSAGLPAAIAKMVAERLAKNQFRNAHQVFKVSVWVSGVMGFVASLVLFFGAGLFSVAIKSPNSYYSMLTLSPTVFIVAIMAVFRGYFQGMKNTVPTAISQIIEQVFNAVFSVYLAYVFVSRGVAYGAAGGTAGTGIGAFFGLMTMITIYYMVRRFIIRKVYTDKDTENFESKKAVVYELLRTAAPIIIGTAIFSVTNLIDMVMVNDRLIACGQFSSEKIEALYGQLTGKYVVLTTLPVSIATSLATVAVPTIASSAAVSDGDGVKRKINMALRLAMIFSIPAAVGIGVLGDQILLLLFPLYPGGGILLRIGAVSIIFLALAQILTGILQGTGYVIIPAFAALCGGLVKIPVNYFLVSKPEINVSGAVISTICCYALASGINMVAIYKKTGVAPDFIQVFLKPVFSAAVMGLSCYVIYYSVYMLVPNNTIACISAILFGVLIYFGFMLAVKGLTKDDIVMFPMGGKLAAILNL